MSFKRDEIEGDKFEVIFQNDLRFLDDGLWGVVSALNVWQLSDLMCE